MCRGNVNFSLANLKNMGNISCWWECGEHCWWECKLMQLFWRAILVRLRLLRSYGNELLFLDTRDPENFWTGTKRNIQNGILHTHQKKKKKKEQPWLVWLSGLSAGLQTKEPPAWFPVSTHVRVGGQVPNCRIVKGSHTLTFSPSSFSLPSLLSKNKF